MELHLLLRDLVDACGRGIVTDSSEFRAALDDYLTDHEISTGDANVLVDAVRLGAVGRLEALLGGGSDPWAAVVDAGGALARDRGSDDPARSMRAVAMLGYALGWLDESVVRPDAPRHGSPPPKVWTPPAPIRRPPPPVWTPPPVQSPPPAVYTPPPSIQAAPPSAAHYHAGNGVNGPPRSTSVLAIISLVSGVVGILCCGIFVFSVAAIVLGALGRREIHEAAGRKEGAGFATAGLILGAAGIVIGVVYWVVAVATA